MALRTRRTGSRQAPRVRRADVARRGHPLHACTGRAARHARSGARMLLSDAIDARPLRARRGAASNIGRHAIASLYDELALYPKPGLVSLRDRGAHDDMDASVFMKSILALRSMFVQAAREGAA